MPKCTWYDADRPRPRGEDRARSSRSCASSTAIKQHCQRDRREGRVLIEFAMLDINLLRNDLPLRRRRPRQARRHARRRGASKRSKPSARTSRRARRSCRRGATRCPSRSASRRARARMPPRCWPKSRASATSSKRLEGELDRVQGELARFPARPAEPPARERAGRHVARRQRRGAPLGHAARLRLSGQGSHRPRRRPRPARFRDGREAVRRALLVPARRSRAPASRARAVHARHAHARARLHRVLHAVHRQRRNAGRHRRSCRSSKTTCSRCRRAASRRQARRSISSRPSKIR